MKKIIIVLVLLLLPMSMFAQFFIGASAMLKSEPLTAFSTWTDPYTLVDNLAFGVDARVNLSVFEIQALALYNTNQSFNAYIDLGIVLNIAIISIGAGVGPNFVVNFNVNTPAVDAFQFGFNGKVHADLNLGSFKISAYYMFLMDSFTGVSSITDNMYAGNFGLSLMLKL